MPDLIESAEHAVRPPSVGAVEFAARVAKRGFLDVAGELWADHGDVFAVRLGHHPLVFLMHPGAVEHVTVSARDRYDKGRSYDGVRKYLTGQGLIGSTGDLWRRERKLMAPFFTPRGVQVYADLIVADALRFADRWDRLADAAEPADISQEMTLVTASIILRAMFSTEHFDSITRMKDAVETMIRFTDRQMVGFRAPLWVPTPSTRRYLAARELVHGSIAEIIAARRGAAQDDWPDDLLARLMTSADPDTGEPMSEHLLRDESITVFFAGHETTARTMAFTWYALAAHPEVAARLHDELDTVLQGRAPTIDDLRRLPYTLQVVKEVLRLYPAAPFYARDAIRSDHIGVYDIPAGAVVMLSPFYTHRHPDFWPDPKRFDPDRWSTEAERARHAHAYHPFAAGPRICIGNNFSLLESHLLLAVLAQRFRLHTAAGYEPEVRMRGTLSIDNGLPMTISRP